jgi:DNA (cytosine-5)-methyltransferase 1
MKYVDLFAGTGAFSHVLEEKGFQCVFANDIMESSQDIYKKNYQGNGESPFVLGDLHDIPVTSIPEHELLCAGFPCQPFSIAGKQDGFRDPRSNVFWKILDIVRYHTPSVIILENVKNLMSHDDGKTFFTILSSLQEIGYFIKHAVLDTSKITSIPHHRERIYIVGFQDEHWYHQFHFDFDTVQNYPIRHYLQPEDNIPLKYYYTDNLRVFPIIHASVTKSIYTGNTVYQYRRHYVRENKHNHCPTLTANMGSGGHNVPLILDRKGIRKLTPRECFNLQGFPDTYVLPTTLSDSALYKLAGNSVSVPVIRRIIENVMAVVGSS